MINRSLTNELLRLGTKYPVITITGPRQSGKTTLVQSVFKEHQYVTFENPDVRQRALSDPAGFFLPDTRNMILDEVQHVPQLLSYIQEITDRNKINGQFVLTGSQSMLLSEKVSQSLAGRTAVLKLFPFDLQELTSSVTANHKTYEELIFRGFYPRIYDQHIEPADFYPFYFETYVQRDIRQILNIRDLNQFSNFVRLCAGRTGQILDYSSLAKDSGISVNTAKGWISLLEASYIICLLHPYYNNFSKRIIKSPKLFFTDTGLAAWLLNIREPVQLETHYLKGGLFENFVVMELYKQRIHSAKTPNLWFFRDNNGNEIDCISEGNALSLIEIKSARTFREDSLKGIKFIDRIATNQPVEKIIISGGDESFQFKGHKVISWRDLNGIV
ncbi:MAG: ATP-binding protein [Bacteroidales bacterium]